MLPSFSVIRAFSFVTIFALFKASTNTCEEDLTRAFVEIPLAVIYPGTEKERGGKEQKTEPATRSGKEFLEGSIKKRLNKKERWKK